MKQRRVALLVLTSLVVSIAVFVFVDPIAQNQAYHQFSDQETLMGIPHFYNVISNLAFLGVGLWGLVRVMRQGAGRWRLHRACLFSGLVLTAFGSTWYHVAPSNFSLVFDRLPITLSFMALFTLLVGSRVHEAAGRMMLLPAVLLGCFSVFYWHITESAGAGDLRLYALVQYLPLLLTAPLLGLFKGSRREAVSVCWAVLFYGLAKVCELWDAQLHELIGFTGGHAFKHLFAAGASWFLLGLGEPER